VDRLRDKVVVITGGTTGIGFASAKLFAREGARVFITGRRQAELDAAVTAIGDGTLGVQGNVAHLADLDRLYETVRHEAGAIDVLFANAGGGSFLQLVDMTEDHYAQTFDANVKGTLFTVTKALPLLKDGASVILTGSTAASKGTPAFSVYSASKAAIRSFARCWILELAPRRIRVNVLAPGATSTPGFHGLATSAEDDRQMQDMFAAMIPTGRMASADEIAQAALFLASDDSSYVNGSEMFVDGGMAQV
jgi:NAD(P)-dependent dehydrogenase (short-subunit alcohol dehydrogenase family)